MSRSKNFCTYCGGSTRTVRNAFYGTGMAVHEWLTVCDRCGIANYDDTEQAPRVPERSRATSRWFWLSSRLRRGK